MLSAVFKVKQLRMGFKLAPVFVCLHSHASGFYECEVQSYYHLAENGVVLEHEFAKTMKGNKFTVNKENGFIDGATVNRGIDTFPKVILEGKEQDPFVAVTVDAKGRYVYQLHIANWSENIKKPFIFYRGDDMMSGLCVMHKAE